MSGELHVARRPPMAELMLNRPAVRNALSRALLIDLLNHLNAAGADPTIRAVVLTGAPPAFCAGLDLDEVTAAGPEFDNAPLVALLEAIENLPKPVIAGVNGAAMAGGAVLAMACDVVVCADGARIGFPGIKRGLVAPVVVSYLCRMVGERQARYLALTGRSIAAERALAIGLVDEVVPDAEVVARTRAIGSELATLAPEVVRETKRVFGMVREMGADAEVVRRLNSRVTRG